MDRLPAFMEWFLRSSLQTVLQVPARAPIHATGKISGLVVYREQDLQVELFIVPPKDSTVEFGSHTHPTVDSIEVPLWGDIKFYLEGELQHNKVRVLPGVEHRAEFGKEGGAFLSFQHWTQGNPSSIGLDWCGRGTDESHSILLGEKYG